MKKRFKRGDVRADGFLFIAYQNRNGRIYERWTSPQAWVAHVQKLPINYKK